MATCTSILGYGVLCGKKAVHGTCGRHTKHPQTLEKAKRILALRIQFIRHTCDYRSRTLAAPGHPMAARPFQELLTMTIPELFTCIRQLEDAILQDYPGWDKPFTTKHAEQIRDIRVAHDFVYKATRRLEDAGRSHQVDLMHQWFNYFGRLCRSMFTVHNPAFLLDRFDHTNLYSPTYIADTLGPALVEIWDRIDVQNKRRFHQVFQNMGALLQLFIQELANILPRPDGQDGAEFVTDNQNVHRSETVKYVQDMFEKLMKIAVPPDQKTLGEVIVKCDLPPKAIMLLTQHYCEPVSIYEIPNAYPRALDAVWAYIRDHSEKEELYKRVKDELTDNIGMCAQGNLSRIINILSGYLDGVGVQQSSTETLANRIITIIKDSMGDKVNRVRGVLAEMRIPEDQWDSWLEAVEDHAETDAEIVD